MATKWTREHEQNRQEILDLLREDVEPFEDLSEPAKKARRTAGLLHQGQTYFPHYIKEECGQVHRTMVRKVGEPGLPTAIGMARGFGKSVWNGRIRPAMRTAAGDVPYWLFISRTKLLAEQSMDCIRLELENNERLHADFGVPTIDGTETEWVVTWPKRGNIDREYRKTKFEAFGARMTVRGRLFGPHRPLEAVLDDMMDEQLARNPDLVELAWKWIFDSVVPAMEPEDYRLTLLDTMYGGDCFLERFKDLAEKKDDQGRPLARCWIQPATDDEGHSVWPERFTDEYLARVRATVGEVNWMRNYALSPEDPDSVFPPDCVVEYDPREIEPGDMHVVAYLDPAISDAPTGCPRALVVAGCYPDDGKRYVLDAWLGRGNGVDMTNRVFEFNERWHPATFGIEQNGGFALIKDLMYTMRRGHDYVPVKWDTASEAKEIRIQRLSTPWANGRWLFPKEPNKSIKALLDQFYAWRPKTSGWQDGPDACSGVDRLLPNPYGRAGGSGFEAKIGGEMTQAAYV